MWHYLLDAKLPTIIPKVYCMQQSWQVRIMQWGSQRVFIVMMQMSGRKRFSHIMHKDIL